MWLGGDEKDNRRHPYLGVQVRTVSLKPAFVDTLVLVAM